METDRQKKIRESVRPANQVLAVNSDRIDQIRDLLNEIAETGDRCALKGLAAEIVQRYL